MEDTGRAQDLGRWLEGLSRRQQDIEARWAMAGDPLNDELLEVEGAEVERAWDMLEDWWVRIWSEPAPPAWLNLDVVCPPGLRARAGVVTGQVLELTGQARPVLASAAGVLAEMDRRVPGGDVEWSGVVVFGPFTGQAALHGALCELADMVEAAL